MSKRQLTESEEILLGKFFDGEATLIERIRVKWLLDRNSNAAIYLEQLESTNLLLRKMIIVPQVSLWGRVSSGIHQAQRLSKTEVMANSSEVSSWIDRLLPSPVKYAVAGAIAASAVFYMMPMTDSTTGIEIDYRSTWNSKPISIQESSRVSITSSQEVRSVGWVRSAGTAQRLTNQSGRSPILFIKRKYARSDSLPLLGERNSEGIVLKGNR